MSHFEMYLDSMNAVGASTLKINNFISLIESGSSVNISLNEIDSNDAIKEFVGHTFSIIETQKPHIIAASFTFGREDVIPDMFLGIIEKSRIKGNHYNKLKYYLERHIELDGDEHGPLSLDMVKYLCGNDELKGSSSDIEIQDIVLKLKLEVIDSVCHDLGYALSSLINLFDIEHIYITGGIANSGNILRRKIEKQGSNNYYNLFLNSETARYVFRIIAVKEIMENPRKYGFMFRDKDMYTMPNYTTVEVDSTIVALADFAKKNGINYKLLKQFNPWLRSTSLPDKSRRKYILKIPTDTDLMVFEDFAVDTDSVR